MSFDEIQNDSIPRNSANELRHHIDQEIEMLNNEKRALKARRNTLAPISQFPPEILSRIFAFTVTDPLEHDALDWIKVSYVSRHWREVALNCPSLWGSLVFTRRKWCRVMLKRSKMASLAVKADLRGILLPLSKAELVRLAMLQGPRIHELEPFCSSKTVMEELLSVDPPLQLPLIRSLSLSIAPPYEFLRPARSFVLPKSILDSEASYLRRLYLRQCEVTWDIPLFNGLTSLTIHRVKSSARPAIEQLVNTLKRMPALEYLDLRAVLPRPTPGAVALPTEKKIYLSRLTDLVIDSTASERVNFVSFIKIPTTARIYFVCTDSKFSDTMRIIATPEATSNCGEGGGGLMAKRDILDMQFGFRKGGSFVFNGWCTSLSAGTRPKSDIQLRGLGTSNGDAFQRIITDICNGINLQHLGSLRITPPFKTLPERTWVEIFGALPQLHTIRVEGQSAGTLLVALCDLPSKPPTADAPARLVSTEKTRSIPWSAPLPE